MIPYPPAHSDDEDDIEALATSVGVLRFLATYALGGARVPDGQVMRTTRATR
jgi:hypothetical protein